MEEELRTSRDVNELLLSRVSELESRLHDSERRAKQFQIALEDAREDSAQVIENLQNENSDLRKLQQVVADKDDEIDRLKREIDNVNLQADAAQAELTDEMIARERQQAAAVKEVVPTSDRGTQCDSEDEVVVALRQQIANLEEQLAEYDALMEDYSRNEGSLAVGDNSSFSQTVAESPRVTVPSLHLGKEGSLSATRKSFNPMLTQREGMIPAGQSHTIFQMSPRESARGGTALMSSRFSTNNFSVGATPRTGGGSATVSETPRIGGHGWSTFRESLSNPGALNKLREKLAEENHDLLMTPRNPALPINNTDAKISSNSSAPAVSATGKRKPFLDIPTREDECQLCGFLVQVDAYFPRSRITDKGTFLGAGWIPDICHRWRAEHNTLWTNEEKNIIQTALEGKPRLKAFPIAAHEGEIFVWRSKRGFWKTPWKECFALIHGVFLYLFPLRNSESELMSATPLRGSTIKRLTHDGRTNCLSIESLGCSRCVGASEQDGVEKLIISLATPTDAMRWTDALVKAQRTCPHECSNVFSDVTVIRDVIEELAMPRDGTLPTKAPSAGSVVAGGPSKSPSPAQPGVSLEAVVEEE